MLLYDLFVSDGLKNPSIGNGRRKMDPESMKL